MSPRDLVVYLDDTFGRHRLYEVQSVSLGAVGQESLIELRCLNETPGRDTDGRHLATTWVPEPLLRSAQVFTAPQNAKALIDQRDALAKEAYALRHELERLRRLTSAFFSEPASDTRAQGGPDHGG